MYAIGAEEEISRSGRAGAIAIGEFDDEPAVRLLVAGQPAADPDRLSAQPYDDGSVDESQELATMNADLRIIISCIDTLQFPPQHLTEAVCVDEFARADAVCIEIR
jgi:hypothetical protein